MVSSIFSSIKACIKQKSILLVGESTVKITIAKVKKKKKRRRKFLFFIVKVFRNMFWKRNRKRGFFDLAPFDWLYWLPCWLSGKEPTCHCRRLVFNPWVGKIPWRRAWQPTPVFLPGKSHEQRSLMSYSPWGLKKSRTHLAIKLQQQSRPNTLLEIFFFFLFFCTNQLFK